MRWAINSDKNVQTLSFLADLANGNKVTQVNPGKTNRTDGAFQLFKDGKVGMVMGFSPLAAQLDAEGKVSYGVAEMPTNTGKSVTLGVEDYLMAFKKKDNQESVKKFLDLYYQPENITRWITAEGFLPVTKSGLQQMSGNAKLKPYLDALPSARLAPTTDPAWDRGEARRPAEHRPRRAAGRQAQATSSTSSRRTPRRRAAAESLTPPARPRGRRRTGRWPALLWLGPSLLLIAAVVVYPAVALIRASLGRYSITGLYQGSVGLQNYARLLEQQALPAVVANTVVWVGDGGGGHRRGLARARAVPQRSASRAGASSGGR